MTIGFVVKTAIVLSRRFGCLPTALDRHPPALAVHQNISLRFLLSLRNFLAVAAHPTEFAVQFFCALAFFVDAPGMIG